MSPDVHPDRHDLALVARIREGSVPAWHAFIERYSGVVHAVVRRYLFREDERRDAWTAVMAHLHDGGLDGYEGRSSLATWLTVVSRGVVCDFLRARRGRRGEPRAVADLDPAARLAFRLLHGEGRDPREIREVLARLGLLADGETLPEVLARVDDVLGTATMRRLAYDLRARDVGALTGRLLEYADLWRQEMRDSGERARPDAVLAAARLRETALRVRALVDRLPERDREVMVRYFDRGETARQIAAEMDLAGQRAAYTAIDRSVRQLRRWLGSPAAWILLGLFLGNP